MSEQNLFITCAPGLELLLIEELQQLGIQDAEKGYRGVYVDHATLETIYKINYCSRIASRVLLSLRHFRCWDQDSLYKGISAIDWSQYIPRGATFAIDSTAHHPAFRNSLFAAQRAKDAICDQFRNRTGSRPNVSVQGPDVQLNLLIHEGKAIISVDTTGDPLHRRGYRKQETEAMLRENLAAALLYTAKFDFNQTLYDLCCGAGTLLVEAAWMASRTPPGFLRKKWGFMLLPDFSIKAWASFRASIDAGRQPLAPGKFVGVDIDKNAIEAAQMNLRMAGVDKAVELVCADFRDYVPAVPASAMITDPPHGNRQGSIEDLKDLYRALGDWMKQRIAPGGRGFVFTSNPELSKEIRLAPKRRYPFDHGGMETRLFEYDIR